MGSKANLRTEGRGVTIVVVLSDQRVLDNWDAKVQAQQWLNLWLDEKRNRWGFVANTHDWRITPVGSDDEN